MRNPLILFSISNCLFWTLVNNAFSFAKVRTLSCEKLCHGQYSTLKQMVGSSKEKMQQAHQKASGRGLL